MTTIATGFYAPFSLNCQGGAPVLVFVDAVLEENWWGLFTSMRNASRDDYIPWIDDNTPGYKTATLTAASAPSPTPAI